MMLGIDEKGPVWRRALWPLMAFELMVAGHFLITDTVIYWIEIAGAVLLFMIAAGALFGMLNHKPGDGSTLTVFFLGFAICGLLGLLFLFLGLDGLGYL